MATIPGYSHGHIGAIWSFVAKNTENPNFTLRNPELLSELVKKHPADTYTFAFRNLDRDLVVDCTLPGKMAISLAAREIVVLPECELAATHLRLESSMRFLCLGNLKFIELGDCRKGCIYPVAIVPYKGFAPNSGNPAYCSGDWQTAIEKAHTIAGIVLPQVGKSEGDRKT